MAVATDSSGVTMKPIDPRDKIDVQQDLDYSLKQLPKLELLPLDNGPLRLIRTYVRFLIYLIFLF